MQHVLRGKNKEADRLANEAMDRGMGRGGAPRPTAALSTANTPTPRPATAGSAPDLPKEVTGFVKNGVVHLVEGELPEGTFVRVLPGRR